MKLLIGADLVPTRSNMAQFCTGDAKALVGEQLLTLLQGADCRIFNLEVPLTDTLAPIAKCGPALIAPTAAAAGYKALGTDLLTVANNHIMDQGEGGFADTVKTLEANGISYVGGGASIQEAAKPFVLEIEGRKIGIYACAEHEFSIAGENTPGANPFDPLESPDHVAALKATCDYVIVLYHGGKEYYRYPSPNLQKICRKLVQKGADLVICQHSHCIGSEEKYLHGTIIYGQGNFLFDDTTGEYGQTALLVQVEDGTVSYIPLCKQDNVVRLAQGAMAEEILGGFRNRSMEIKDPNTLEHHFAAFAQEMRLQYLTAFGGRESFVFRVANRLMGNRLRRMRIKKRYSAQKLLAIRNYVECEAHREVFLRGMNCDT